MRKITTAITAVALALSMQLAVAAPAAAITGYDSAYAGESAFVNISGGQTQNFQVFFANTGTTSWIKGTGTQVDLAACLEDKVTCNAQDASEATWNNGWLSAVRYASTTQTSTPPGSLGTFSYNITAPVGVAAGIYHFNGDVVLASTGEKLHPEGYFQDANTGASSGAPTITSLTPPQGPAGTDVVIAGSGFVCTPAFPTVSFGGTNGVVLSCGATSITVDAPAHALGSVTVTVANTGSGASNGLPYTYTDTTGPTFTSMTVTGDVVNVTFNEPVCGTYSAADWRIQNISAGTTDYAAGSTSNLPTDCDDAVATFSIFLGTAMPPGAFVEATILSGANTNDVSGNDASAPQSRQATATAPETTKPTFISATGATGTNTITLNFSEPIWCDSGLVPSTDIRVDDLSTSTDPTVTGFGSNVCGAARTAADTAFSIVIGAALKADTTYTVTLRDPEAANDIFDTVNNALSVPASVSFVSGAGDFTPPTIVDARMTQTVGSSNFEDVGDSFSLTFSEAMTAGDEIGDLTLQDQDGTVLRLNCVSANVGCTWNTAKTTVTVVLQNTFACTSGTTGAPTCTGTESGTTPGTQIPFNVASVTGASFTDQQGNAANVLGSADRLVDFE
jgi:IPT/TIG domain-containing protein/Big-like domain-containing protein